MFKGFINRVSLDENDVLVAHISQTANLSARITPYNQIYGSLCISKDFESYDGDYEVTPSISEQILDVSDKKMNEDIIIKPIPFFEVSNKKGTTVIIGG